MYSSNRIIFYYIKKSFFSVIGKKKYEDRNKIWGGNWRKNWSNSKISEPQNANVTIFGHYNARGLK